MFQEWNDTFTGTENDTLLLLPTNQTSYAARDINSSLLEEIERSKRFLLPWWRVLLWSILFGFTVLISAIGNLVVIWIVVSDRRMRNVTNYFLVNLSIADTMVALLNVIFTFVYMVTNHWPFGYVYCKISQYIAVVSVSGSVFTLIAISVERYLAIMYPLRPRMGKSTTACFIITVWAASFLISIPHLLYAKTDVLVGSGRTACYLHWPDGFSFESYQEYVYNVIFTVLTYFLPICAMSFAYFQVGRDLWGSKGIGECTDFQLENIRCKRKIVKMMIVVVTIFAICWLPYHVYFIVSWLYPQINGWDNIQEIFLGIYWLAMSNASYYPMIYCWMNLKFRIGFLRVFRICCGCKSVNKQGSSTPSDGRGLSCKSYPGSLNRGYRSTQVAGIAATIPVQFNNEVSLRNLQPGQGSSGMRISQKRITLSSNVTSST